MEAQKNNFEEGKVEELVDATEGKSNCSESVSKVEEMSNSNTEQVQSEVETLENVVETSSESVAEQVEEESVKIVNVEDSEQQELAMSDNVQPESNAVVEQDVPLEEEVKENNKHIFSTREEILARLCELSAGETIPTRDEVDVLKTLFYKMFRSEQDALYKQYIDEGGDSESYKPAIDPLEEAFKAGINAIKDKRMQLIREQEVEKEANLKRKLEIIEKIKGMVTSPEEVNKSYKEFKDLQQEWKEIKSIPATKANEVWRNYQHYVEQFYDLLKLNNEAREYDFKKNLEQKNRLCEEAERLVDEKSVIKAFQKLQILHQEYREVGPVAKDLREEIWNRFKAASTVINKRHQQYFEDIRAGEEDNLAKKTALCEKVEAIVAIESKNASDWIKRSKEIIELQTEWKTIGYAPQKTNVKIFERFRTACDVFFSRKTEFFKKQKEVFKENATKKRELIEKARELKDSTDWKGTADAFVALQKEWKAIGPVSKKLGDQLWEEFISLCNQFFDARKAANADLRGSMVSNLKKKQEVIEKIKTLAEEGGEDAQNTAQQLVEEYHTIGHVPYKDKDKIYDKYVAALDLLFQKQNISVSNRRLDSFKESLKNMAQQDDGALNNQRARLVRQYEALKNNIQTYENNIGFLSASSKKGSKLIEDMKRKMQKLNDEMILMKEKIKAIDSEMNS